MNGTIKYRAANSYDTRRASDEAVAWTDCGPSQTIQSQAEDADINVLMKRYGITGKMPDNPRVPTYGDFSEITDYRSAVEAIQKANEGFAELPAEVRATFQNDPQLLLEFLANDQNRDHAVSLGLVKAPQPAIPPPPATTVAGPSTAAPAAPNAPA